MPDTPKVDLMRNRDGNPFDHDDGPYGQEYSQEREAALGVQQPSGTVAARPDDPAPPINPATPPENGRRASFDPQSGEVRGSGSGAGGGNPSEDFDSDSASGDDYPITGVERIEKKASTGLGPPRLSE